MDGVLWCELLAEKYQDQLKEVQDLQIQLQVGMVGINREGSD